MTELVMQMIAALALVILLIFVMAYAYRKKNRGTALISLVSYQSIGQKIGIAALRIGGEILVIGVTPTDFKLLKRLDGDVPSPDTGPGPQRPSLRNIFRSPKNEAVVRTGRVAETIEKIRGLKEEING